VPAVTVTRPGRQQAAEENHEHYVYRILSALIREPERTVVLGSGLALTAGALAQSVFSVASLLRDNGVTHGSTVAILTEANHPHMLTIRYAAHLVGATTAYIRSSNARSDEWMLPAADQTQMLTEVDAALLVTDPASLARGRELCRDLPCDAVAADLTAVAPSESAAELGNAIHSLPSAGYGPHSHLVVVYTSGSTGRPKGVCHSFGAWNNMVAGFEAVVRGASPPRFLAVTPIGQTVGVMVDGTLAAGGSVVLHERFIVDEALRAFTELAITDCYLAVPHIYALTDDPRIAGTDLSKLRNVIYSGSPAAPHRIAQAARVFGRTLLQSYGSTEAGPISYLGSWEHRKADRLPTVGRPYPGVRVRVCQPGRVRELPPGHTGEIWVKSGNIMSGYLSDPGLTAQVLRDGWLRTGDLGFLDDSGYLTLAGRIGHAIKNNGLKVYPDTIEQTLMMHPDVSGAAVIGIRHRKDYEEAYAAVTLRPSATARLSELREHLNVRLSADQVPAIIAHWEALPADDSGKTDKRRLQALVEGGDCARHGLLNEE
jgi:fatty-acyl-CoA synthase